jgi:hypothetical protein
MAGYAPQLPLTDATLTAQAGGNEWFVTPASLQCAAGNLQRLLRLIDPDQLLLPKPSVKVSHLQDEVPTWLDQEVSL